MYELYLLFQTFLRVKWNEKLVISFTVSIFAIILI